MKALNKETAPKAQRRNALSSLAEGKFPSRICGLDYL